MLYFLLWYAIGLLGSAIAHQQFRYRFKHKFMEHLGFYGFMALMGPINLFSGTAFFLIEYFRRK